MKRYNFICVNYNGSNFTKSLLESLEVMEIPIECAIRLIVVDNKSHPDDKLTLEKISSSIVDLVVIENKENIGYFPALNVGITFAKSDESEKIIIGNNDLTYSKDFLTVLEVRNFSEEVLVISPDVLTLDGYHQNPLSNKRLTRLEIFVERLYYSNYYISRFMILTKRLMKKILTFALFSQDYAENVFVENEMPILRGIGACYVLTDHFFKKFTLLDDRVFLWGEEALLSNQVRTVNGVILYVPSLLVHHCESGSVKKLLTRERYEIVRKSFKVYKEYL
jgi:GT2 family glycosyltransferase